MSFKCPFCIRYFSTRSAYSQHKNYCMPLDNDSDDSEELELEPKTDDRDDSEKLGELEPKTDNHDIEVRKL